jgi:hypothetical protein
MATAYHFGDSYCYVIVFIVIFIVAAVLIILIVGLLLWMRLWCVIALPLPTIFLVTPHLVSLPPTPLGVLPRIYHNGRREGDDFSSLTLPPACHLPRSPLPFFAALPRPTIPRPPPPWYTVIS